MLEKLTRMLKIKQKLTLDPSSYDFFEMDRFSISRIEVTGRQSVSDNIPVTSTWVAIGLGLQAGDGEGAAPPSYENYITLWANTHDSGQDTWEKTFNFMQLECICM